MKKYIIILTCLLLSSKSFATELNELNSIKEPAYRLGITKNIETRYKKIDKIETESVRTKENTINIENLTYADLSIKKISKEISQELELDQDIMTEDLSLLWQGAATKSDIIKFALYKLSNPDADKPNDKSIKKVLSTIASMSTLVGAGMGSPILASGAFMGGNLMGIMSQDDKALNYKYTKVNDADMILLVRKVEELQQNVVNQYYEYITARKILDMTIQMTHQRKQNYDLAQNGSKDLILITDAYYRDAIDRQNKAKNDFYAKRSSLEQLVGKDIFRQFEKNINERTQ